MSIFRSTVRGRAPSREADCRSEGGRCSIAGWSVLITKGRNITESPNRVEDAAIKNQSPPEYISARAAALGLSKTATSLRGEVIVKVISAFPASAASMSPIQRMKTAPASGVAASVTVSPSATQSE